MKVAEAGEGRGIENEIHVLEYKVQADLLQLGAEWGHLQLLRLGIEEPEVLDIVSPGVLLLRKILLKPGRVPLLSHVVVLLNYVQHLLPGSEYLKV